MLSCHVLHQSRSWDTCSLPCRCLSTLSLLIILHLGVKYIVQENQDFFVCVTVWLLMKQPTSLKSFLKSTLILKQFNSCRPNQNWKPAKTPTCIEKRFSLWWFSHNLWILHGVVKNRLIAAGNSERKNNLKMHNGLGNHCCHFLECFKGSFDCTKSH